MRLEHINYGRGWLAGKTGIATAVEGQDVHGFMELCNGVTERELDLIVHSPGGSPEAAEQIVEYLRTQFDDVRCFVPLQGGTHELEGFACTRRGGAKDELCLILKGGTARSLRLEQPGGR